ncbi:MAG: ATP-binding protein [Prevotellaceae bacterium]|jgi:predicted AAA+ superfamily ATPase|nr:ATP-binding protein [Prevotellaceae bacterium]
MITRSLANTINDKLWKNKAIIVMGARQVGKTSLLKMLFANANDVLWLNADEPDVRALFENATSAILKQYFGNHKIIIVDEAQRISDVGVKLKLITDQIRDKQLIATGSSSFALANKINEPLTGRKWEYKMFPLSFGEMVNHHGLINEKRLVPHRMIYGYYPDIVTHEGDEKSVLLQLADSYLYKDVLANEGIRKPDVILKLLQALAFQISGEVSIRELGEVCSIDSKTVEKYISLLEQSYVIFRLSSFSRNLRNELKNKRKIYFYDNGIRNALINNFNPVDLRQDTGALFENFAVSERLKFLNYNQQWKNRWFWRTTEKQEIDYIEESDGQIEAFEFKWNPKKQGNIPQIFKKTYTGNIFKVINRDNVEEFLM